MAGYEYAQSELHEEAWGARLKRVTDDTRHLIAATRKVINESRQCLASADESLKRPPVAANVEAVVPIRAFLHGKWFDLETIEAMNTAFLGACADLGLSDKIDGACEIIAARVIELADGQDDAEAIRKAVLASIRGPTHQLGSAS